MSVPVRRCIEHPRHTPTHCIKKPYEFAALNFIEVADST